MNPLNHKPKRILLAAGIALCTGLLTACTPAQDQVTDPPDAPETTQDSPTETEAPVEEFGVFERKNPLPADLEYLHNMTAAEFAKQPKLEQLRWASWAGQYKDEFIDSWLIISPETKQYDGHYTLTAESDALTALQDMSYQNRISANFGRGRDPQDKRFNGKLDTQSASKYIAASVTLAGQWRVENFINERLSTNDGQAINVATQAKSDMYNLRQDAETAEDFKATPIVREIEGIQYHGWRVQYTDADYGPLDNLIVIVPFVDYLGNQSFASVFVE